MFVIPVFEGLREIVEVSDDKNKTQQLQNCIININLQFKRKYSF